MEAHGQDTPNFCSYECETLLLALTNGTCIFFGAGISKLAGYMLWEELKAEMISYFWENRAKLRPGVIDFSLCESLRTHGDIIESFDYLYYIDKTLFVKGIKDIFARGEKKNQKI